MVLDASFTSVGLGYFGSWGLITTLRELQDTDVESLRVFWKNRRSWQVASSVGPRIWFGRKRNERCQASLMPGELKADGDLSLIETVRELGQATGYRSLDICWMCWLLSVASPSSEEVDAVP